MRHCDKCGVDVAGARDFCPLCQNELAPGDGGDRESFPQVPTVYRQYHFLFRMLIFASVAAAVAAVAVNLMVPWTGAWSVFVAGGIVCLWISLAVAVRKRKNIPKGVLYQVALLSVICVLWDVGTGWHGWSIDYVVPILCTAALAALAVLYRVFHWRMDNLVIYICLNALFGVVPLVLYLTGCVRVPYPSILCVAGAILAMAALAVFKSGSIRDELKRRLHI